MGDRRGDATFLIKIVAGRPAEYLRSDEAGLGGTSDDFVVWNPGAGAHYDPVDAGNLMPGLVSVNGIDCQEAFELYAEQKQVNTVAFPTRQPVALTAPLQRFPDPSEQGKSHRSGRPMPDTGHLVKPPGPWGHVPL